MGPRCSFAETLYLNLSLAYEHVGDVTIPTQVIEYNKKKILPIRLKYYLLMFTYMVLQFSDFTTCIYISAQPSEPVSGTSGVGNKRLTSQQDQSAKKKPQKSSNENEGNDDSGMI
jgi:hypothetical protein